MPGTERIDSLYDIPAIRKEQEELLAMLKQLGVTIGDVNNNGAGSKNTKTFSDAKKAAADLDEQTRKLADSTDKVAAASQKYAQSQSDAAKETAKLNVQTQEQNKSNKEAAREALGLNDAYKKLEQQYNAAQRSAKNLAAEQGENSEAFIKAAADAKKLSDRLKEIDNAVGQNQRNVGNYKESFSILEKELTSVTSKINALKSTARDPNGGPNSGPRGGDPGAVRAQEEELKKLVRQENALTQVISNNSRGFASLNQELKINERALQTMRAAGLGSAEAFKNLQTEVNHTRKEVNDFSKTQKILSSDLPAITGLTVAAKGLAGAYALGAGAAALFGDEEGKIEKEVQKLVAIMTVLNGLQEVHELLEQKDAVATAIASAAQQVYTFVVGESVGALKAFRIALAATGIGLLVITLGYLIENWDKLFKAVDPVVDLIDKSKNITRAAQQSLKSYGDTAEKISEGIMKKLADEVKGLNDALKKTPSTAEDAANQLSFLQQRIIDLNKANLKLQDDGIGINEYTSLEYRKNATEVEGLQVQVRGLNAQLSETVYLQNLLNREEDRKAYADSFIEALKSGQAANALLLSDARTTYQKKVQLLSENAKLENVIIEKQYEIDSRAADKNHAEQIKADTKYHAALTKAAQDFGKAQQDLDREFEETNLGAKNATKERVFQDEIDRNKKVADDETRTADIRVKALLKFADASEKLLAQQEKAELHAVDLAGGNQAKKNDIINKYEAARYELEKSNSDALFQLQVSVQKREILTLYDGLRIKADLYATSYAQLKDIQYKGLTALSKDIDNSHQNEFVGATNAGITTANENIKKLAETGKGLGKVFMHLFPQEANENIDDYIKKIGMLKDAAKKLIAETVTTITSLINDGFENKKNAIQDEQDANAKAYEQEVAQINNSTLAEEDKANKLKILDSQKAAQDEQYERRKRQVQQEQARFQKAASVAQIIADTAQAVIAALEIGPPQGFALAAITAAIGAVQLARAIATPIPKYEKGTASAAGGPSIVSEKGSELVIEPSGKAYLTPATETLMNIPKGSKVIPNDEINQMMYAQMMRNTVGRIQEQKDTSVKDAIMWQTAELKKAYGNHKRPINITVNDFKGSDYIRKAVKE